MAHLLDIAILVNAEIYTVTGMYAIGDTTVVLPNTFNIDEYVSAAAVDGADLYVIVPDVVLSNVFFDQIHHLDIRHGLLALYHDG